jgi:hypothetical protein
MDAHGPIPIPPEKPDQSVTLNYGRLRPPKPIKETALFVGRLSVYLIIIQIIFVVFLILAPFFFVMFAWGSPPGTQWLWLLLLLCPTILALGCGSYSVAKAGFNPRNLPGIIGVSLATGIILFAAAAWYHG